MKRTWWRITRTIIFLVGGLRSTVFIDSALTGSLENYLGYALLLLAIIDISTMVYEYIKNNKESK